MIAPYQLSAGLGPPVTCPQFFAMSQSLFLYIPLFLSLNYPSIIHNGSRKGRSIHELQSQLNLSIVHTATFCSTFLPY